MTSTNNSHRPAIERWAPIPTDRRDKIPDPAQNPPEPRQPANPYSFTDQQRRFIGPMTGGGN